MLFCLSSEIDLVSCWLHTSCWSSKNTLGSAVPLAMFDNDIFLSVYNVHVLTSQNATNVTTTRTAWYDFINSKMWFEVERNTIIYKSDKCFNPHHKFRFGILHWPTKISVGCKPSCGEDYDGQQPRQVLRLVPGTKLQQLHGGRDWYLSFFNQCMPLTPSILPRCLWGGAWEDEVRRRDEL